MRVFATDSCCKQIAVYNADQPFGAKSSEILHRSSSELNIAMLLSLETTDKLIGCSNME